MDCRQFLTRYSDFRDGLVTLPRERRRFERHLARCEQCRRYDTAVRRGALALQGVGHVEPSPGFRRRLDERLRRERHMVAPPVLPKRANVVAAFFVALAVTMVVLEVATGGRRRLAVAPELPPVPFPKPVAQAGLPLVTFQDPRASVLGNPNPYGTALVQPASAHVEPAAGGR
jgi:hypothetical protein